MSDEADGTTPVQTLPVGNILKEATSGSLHSISQSVFQSEGLPEVSDTKQISSADQDNAARYEKLIKLTRTLKDKSRGLDNLTGKNVDQVLAGFQETVDEALDVSQKQVKAYMAEGSAIEEALTALAEYNQKALARLNKLMVDAVKMLGEAHVSGNQDQVKASEALIEQTKMLVKTAEQQVAYSKEMGTVAKPLTSWRLDAFRLLWEARNALKRAENQCAEVKEQTNPQPVEPGSTQPALGSVLSDQRDATETQPVDSKAVPQAPPKVASSGTRTRT